MERFDPETLPQMSKMSAPTQPRIEDVPLERIHASPNPLRPLDDAKVTEIANSMRMQGQLSPILVRPIGDDYQLVYGNHRLAAARLLHWTTIRCEIRILKDDQAFLAAWSENSARNEYVDPLAEAHAFHALTQMGYTQSAIAEQIGRPQQYVSGRLSLLRLDPELQSMISRGLISAEHGIELSRLDARTARVLGQLCSRDRENPLRLEELRSLARQRWEQLVLDPRVRQLLANDPVEQVRLLSARVEQLEATILSHQTLFDNIQTGLNWLRRAVLELNARVDQTAVDGIMTKAQLDSLTEDLRRILSRRFS